MPAVRRMTVVAALAVGASVAWASAASAHAILLRTEPSPQTTVARSPTSIRLEFSEPVEAAFGAVRVFDVDGRRVDPAKVTISGSGRQMVVPVRPLADGTYTVTWRVASADGHPVSGGFGFYVGAPSTISAVAVARDTGPSTSVVWGYGAVRFAWLSAFMGLVGMVAVRRWVWTPAVRAAGLEKSAIASAFRSRFARTLPAAWLVLAVAGLLTLVFQAATVSGLSLTEAARPGVLGQVLETTFGRLWVAQAGLTGLAAVPVVALARSRPLFGWPVRAWIAVLGVVAFGLSLVTALSGHARASATPPANVPSVAVHLVAVGVWVGGLGALLLLGSAAWSRLPADRRAAFLREVVARFSRLAVAAVIVVVATGLVSSFGELAGPADLWRVAYGRVLAAKIVLLVMALVLASRHRRTVAARPGRFRWTASVELGLLAGTTVLAAALVALVPGRSLALAERGPVNQERRAGGYTVQLFVDPTAVGANQVHVTFVDKRGLGAAEVANATVALLPPAGPPMPMSMRLISPGHFVGDAELPGPGRYRLSVASPAAPSTTFDFRLQKRAPEMPKRLLVLAVVSIAMVGSAVPAWAHEEVSPAVFPVGRPAFLTVSAANERSVDLTRLTLTAPAGLPFGEAARQPPGWAAQASEEVVTWSGGRVAPHAFEQWGFEIEGADQPGSFRYKVTIGFADGSTEASEVEVTAVPSGATSAPTTVSAGTVPAATAPSATTPTTVAEKERGDSSGTALTLSIVALVFAVIAMGLARRRPASPSAGGGTEAPKDPGQDW